MTIVSRPALTTLGLPLTGAASSAVPRFSASARTAADASAEIVVESTTTAGAGPDPDSSPSGPATTCWKSAEPARIVNTMSRSPSSAGWSTIVAPSSASGSHFARVRL